MPNSINWKRRQLPILFHHALLGGAAMSPPRGARRAPKHNKAGKFL